MNHIIYCCSYFWKWAHNLQLPLRGRRSHRNPRVCNTHPGLLQFSLGRNFRPQFKVGQRRLHHLMHRLLQTFCVTDFMQPECEGAEASVSHVWPAAHKPYMPLSQPCAEPNYLFLATTTSQKSQALDLISCDWFEGYHSYSKKPRTGFNSNLVLQFKAKFRQGDVLTELS